MAEKRQWRNKTERKKGGRKRKRKTKSEKQNPKGERSSSVGYTSTVK